MQLAELPEAGAGDWQVNIRNIENHWTDREWELFDEIMGEEITTLDVRHPTTQRFIAQRVIDLDAEGKISVVDHSDEA